MNKTDKIYPTWEELVKMESGTILEDWYDDGVRCLIIRGPSSLCAYLGVPLDHPLLGGSMTDGMILFIAIIAWFIFSMIILLKC